MLNQPQYNQKEAKQQETEDYKNIDISNLTVRKHKPKEYKLYIKVEHGDTIKTFLFIAKKNKQHNDWGEVWKAYTFVDNGIGYEYDFSAFTLRNLKGKIADYYG